MITECMTLNTRADADTWAAQLGLNDDQEARASEWIWNAKPFIGCTKSEHPLDTISDEDWWNIVDPN